MTVPAQTRDPLPDGVTSMQSGPPCTTCGPRQFAFSGSGASPFTRSTEPNADGRYTFQPHAEWCPVWSQETPRIVAPCCGAPVEGYDYTAAFWLIVPGVGPDGMPVDQHVLSTTASEARLGAFPHRREPAPQFDTAILTPCGHTVEGGQAHVVMKAIGVARAEDRRAAAEQTLASQAELLAAATAAGHGEIAEQYRQAVHRGDRTAAGLLVALKTLTGALP